MGNKLKTIFFSSWYHSFPPLKGMHMLNSHTVEENQSKHSVLSMQNEKKNSRYEVQSLKQPAATNKQNKRLHNHDVWKNICKSQSRRNHKKITEEKTHSCYHVWPFTCTSQSLREQPEMKLKIRLTLTRTLIAHLRHSTEQLEFSVLALEKIL